VKVGLTVEIIFAMEIGELGAFGVRTGLKFRVGQ